MTGVHHRKAGPEASDMRLDRWFKEQYPDLKFGRLSKLVRTGQVRVNGKRVKLSDRLSVGDDIRIPPLGDLKPAAPKDPSVPEADQQLIRDMVIREEKNFYILNKPAGLAVQGGSGTNRHIDGMLPALAGRGEERPRLVHRLDRDTSGVLVIARNRKAAQGLTAAFKDRTTEKTYWALVKGVPENPAGIINLPLKKREGRGGEKMDVADDGKRSVTWFNKIEDVSVATWLALRPVTGRTHQLRAHTAAMGTPIVGDGKYGGKESFLEGQVSRKLHLHARSIGFMWAGKRVDVAAPLPKHMAATWDFFGFENDTDEDPFEGFSE